mgnify:CR=1 FL=1
MLRIATIGTSMITDDFIQVVNANDQAAFVGTLSRDADRGAAFTTKHGGERNFTALDELASADDVDAVYIGSPNALHYEQALACIAGGKHVIVEKPFCATEAQALEVFRAAEAAGVVASRPCVPSTIPPSTPSRTPWARSPPSAAPHCALANIPRATTRFSRDAPPISSTAIWHRLPHGHWRLHRRAMVEIFGMPPALRAWLLCSTPPRNSSRTAPSMAAAPSSPATAVAASPSSSRTPKLRTTCCPRKSKASVALSRSTICPRPATSASTIAATSYAARDRGTARTGRQRARARPAQIEQHYGIRTHRLYHRHLRHR